MIDNLEEKKKKVYKTKLEKVELSIITGLWGQQGRETFVSTVDPVMVFYLYICI